jgi:hypothetical protein
VKSNERGTILLIFVGFLSVCIASFITATNIFSIISDQKSLRNVVDQAALIGTNQINLEYYYTTELSDQVILDSREADKFIRDFVNARYQAAEVIKLEIVTLNSQVSVNIEKKSYLPFSMGLDYVKIRASATAMLQVN